MRFQNRFFSTLQSVFCARFHVARGPASSLDCQLPSPSEYAADRRLEIFFEQQKQPWNALKKLDADIIVTVLTSDGVGVPTSFKFDAMSPPPTPAHILSLLPDSIHPSLGSMNSSAQRKFPPIAAAANGHVVGLGRSALLFLAISDVCLRAGDVLEQSCRCLISGRYIQWIYASCPCSICNEV